MSDKQNTNLTTGQLELFGSLYGVENKELNTVINVKEAKHYALAAKPEAKPLQLKGRVFEKSLADLTTENPHLNTATYERVGTVINDKGFHIGLARQDMQERIPEGIDFVCGLKMEFDEAYAPIITGIGYRTVPRETRLS